MPLYTSLGVLFFIVLPSNGEGMAETQRGVFLVLGTDSWHVQPVAQCRFELGENIVTVG